MMIRKSYCFLLLLGGLLIFNNVRAQTQPVKIAVAGISHDHSWWIFNRPAAADISWVGFYEPDSKLVKRAVENSRFPEELFYDELEEMLNAVKPDAVVAFGPIYDHLKVVQACAPRGIDVMVEKPLAVSVAQAKKMKDLAQKCGIHLLTDYETSWYPTTIKAKELIVDSGYTGGLTKAVFRDGHQGPKEIGVSDEFFEWLTDPVQNGGGAVIDFGCYGANLMTWLTNGEPPISVTATLRQFKPEIYPKVDDDALIIVQYEDAEAIIQASWNWPFNRKDMSLYGTTGSIETINDTDMFIRRKGDNTPHRRKYDTSTVDVYRDPFSYFADVIRGKIKMDRFSLYSLENNIMVVKILEAAKKSGKTGETVFWEED